MVRGTAAMVPDRAVTVLVIPHFLRTFSFDQFFEMDPLQKVLKMLRINEYIEPGIYRHYKGNYYVVENVITHLDGPSGKMEPIADPLVCYRDVAALPKHVNGKPTTLYHQTYARPLSEFLGNAVNEGGQSVKRFTKE